MSKNVRNLLILAGALAAYAMLVWLYESAAMSSWSEKFPTDPRAIFAATSDRDRMIEQEMSDDIDTNPITEDDMPRVVSETVVEVAGDGTD